MITSWSGEYTAVPQQRSWVGRRGGTMLTEGLDGNSLSRAAAEAGSGSGASSKKAGTNGPLRSVNVPGLTPYFLPAVSVRAASTWHTHVSPLADCVPPCWPIATTTSLGSASAG